MPPAPPPKLGLASCEPRRHHLHPIHVIYSGASHQSPVTSRQSPVTSQPNPVWGVLWGEYAPYMSYIDGAHSLEKGRGGVRASPAIFRVPSLDPKALGLSLPPLLPPAVMGILRRGHHHLYHHPLSSHHTRFFFEVWTISKFSFVIDTNV